MPGLLSRLNCFSNSRKTNHRQKQLRREETDDGEGGQNCQHPDYDDVQKLLLAPTRSFSNATEPTSSPSPSPNGSTLSPTLNTRKQHNEYNADDSSIPTMDSDYKQVNSGNFSLSDAGGTFNTNGQSLTNFSHAAESAFGTVRHADASSQLLPEHDYRFGDRISFSSRPSDADPSSSSSSSAMQPSMPLRETTVVVIAPPGKLGLVIDTPRDANTGRPSAPTVHAIKDTCPVRSRIYVGDRLVAVDDVDVREMEAGEVSGLIGGRRKQEERRLTLVRTASGRDGMY